MRTEHNAGAGLYHHAGVVPRVGLLLTLLVHGVLVGVAYGRLSARMDAMNREVNLLVKIHMQGGATK
jgi:hypothetical protein